ncbi:hypothetical protein BDN72DRAFT_839172 [Pluteus cervinus]|uniref:Uncharacterized protein n=1 Tax=Pluteus cervinus TaxID=181527 RepID=A0ACD3AXI4_9AGAR|nr:hypothetical protein BDN72DRAFT_839172 [Pluteus cervinus]
MPPTPKTSSVKKAGAPKSKGATRAKTGCYTCRIRRKKCDEKADPDGSCETCKRLRLECLGFGTKRPQWLRESNSVTELREKIKSFLASQGMIKGHSGAGARGSNEQEQAFLRLKVPDSPTSDSPTVTDPSPSPRPHNQASHQTSHLRAGPQWYSPEYDDTSASRQGSHPPYGGHSSASPFDDDMHHIYENNTSIVQFQPPTQRSSFGASYHTHFMHDTEALDQAMNDQNGMPFPSWAAFLPAHTSDFAVEAVVKQYGREVFWLQYLLGDTTILPFIEEGIRRHEPSRSAVTLLLEVFSQRGGVQPGAYYPISRVDRMQVKKMLQDSSHDGDSAMTSLHMVSAHLFEGGGGDWPDWLLVASQYVRFLLTQKRASGYGIKDSFLRCSPKDNFVIKTTIWFDVLASLTTQRKPILLDLVRELFNPNPSSIEEMIGTPQSFESSMMTPMGCDNHVVWALAETGVLAEWKRNQANLGRLSIAELVEKAKEIEEVLERPSSRTDVLDLNSQEYTRFLTSEIFRTSTRLYLCTVVSGDHPMVPEIQEAVGNVIQTIQPLQAVPATMATRVIRSTVFAFFLCGSLATEHADRQLIDLLLQRECQNAVGNCPPIRRLLAELWHRGDLRGPVEWQQALKKANILLV